MECAQHGEVPTSTPERPIAPVDTCHRVLARLRCRAPRRRPRLGRFGSTRPRLPRPRSHHHREPDLQLGCCVRGQRLPVPALDLDLVRRPHHRRADGGRPFHPNDAAAERQPVLACRLRRRWWSRGHLRRVPAAPEHVGFPEPGLTGQRSNPVLPQRVSGVHLEPGGRRSVLRPPGVELEHVRRGHRGLHDPQHDVLPDRARDGGYDGLVARSRGLGQRRRQRLGRALAAFTYAWASIPTLQSPGRREHGCGHPLRLGPGRRREDLPDSRSVRTATGRTT